MNLLIFNFKWFYEFKPNLVKYLEVDIPRYVPTGACRLTILLPHLQILIVDKYLYNQL